MATEFDPKGAKYWFSVGKEWRETKPQKLWRVHSDSVNKSILERWLAAAPVGTLLKTDLFDEATSDGLYPLLKARARKVICAELTRVAISDACRMYSDLTAVEADVRSLPFVEDTFDVIVSNSTLDHFATLEEMTASILELRRVLKVGGRLILTLDNLANPLIALRHALPFNLLNNLGILPYYVGKTMGPRHLSLKLASLGFDLSKTTAIMHCPRVIAVALSNLLERHASPKRQKQFLQGLMSFESLAGLPTRFFTGYFIAVLAVKK